MTDQKYRYFCSIDTCLVFLGGGWTVWNEQPFSAILYHLFMEGGGGDRQHFPHISFLISRFVKLHTQYILNCMCVERRGGVGGGLYEKKIEVFKSFSSTLSPCFVLLYYAKFALLLFYCFLLHDVRFLGTTLTSTSIFIHTHTCQSHIGIKS